RAFVKYGTTAASVRDPLTHYDAGADLAVPTAGAEVRGQHFHIRINSLGFRGDEIARVKPAGTLRLAVLGASTTFNAEVSSNEATWTHQLQQKLRTAYPGVGLEVINTALSGYI